MGPLNFGNRKSHSKILKNDVKCSMVLPCKYKSYVRNIALLPIWPFIIEKVEWDQGKIIFTDCEDVQHLMSAQSLTFKIKFSQKIAYDQILFYK